ncbi:extracellular solute-binding protein [Labedella populi]|nr:extracellular solute-binding protein [Labedella populi]
MTQNRTLRLTVMSTVVTGALILAGCSSDSEQTIAESAPEKLEGTVSLWHFFSGREAEVVQSVIDDFEAANPDVTVEVNSGQDDDKLQKVISSGGNIDVGLSYSTAIVGKFCSTGAFVDLNPYIERDDVDMDDVLERTLDYTSYDGVQCTLPALTDTGALMYNKTIFDAAGITEPPKTLTELHDIGMELTTFNADGSIKQLGFNPLVGFYENSPSHFAAMTGASFLDEDGNPDFATDPAWSEVIEWQKAFVDEIGYDKLQRFTAGLGQEFSADNAFNVGKVVMNMDGEYRTAFLADQVPDLDYGVAPLPVVDDAPDLYGAGWLGGNVAGIAKGSDNKELAWALLKFMTTDTDAVVKMANGLKNIPTLHSALESPNLEVSDEYRVFLEAAQHEHSVTMPATADGAAYAESFADFWTTYQTGESADLEEGLTELDAQIADAFELAGQ